MSWKRSWGEKIKNQHQNLHHWMKQVLPYISTMTSIHYCILTSTGWSIKLICLPLCQGHDRQKYHLPPIKNTSGHQRRGFTSLGVQYSAAEQLYASPVSASRVKVRAISYHSHSVNCCILNNTIFLTSGKNCSEAIRKAKARMER